jgi:hypothetical protein
VTRFHLRPLEAGDVQGGDLVLGLVDRLVDQVELALELLRLGDLGLVGLDHPRVDLLLRREHRPQRLELGHDLLVMMTGMRRTVRHPDVLAVHRLDAEDSAPRMHWIVRPVPCADFLYQSL